MKYECLWYVDEENICYETRTFNSRKQAMDFYEKHKNDRDKFDWWVTKRDENWIVEEDLIY